MAAAPQVGGRLRRFLPLLFLAASPAFATTFFLTVAGLGGEPDYETRFALLATDTDKILRGSGGNRAIGLELVVKRGDVRHVIGRHDAFDYERVVTIQRG